MIVMHSFILSLLLLCMSTSLTAQSPCCASAATQFASLSTGTAFQDAHQVPPGFKHTGIGIMASIPVPGSTPTGIYDVEARDGSTGRTVLMFHEWWGLNDHIKREADRLATDLGNVRVIAVDLYDGLVATNRADAAKLMQENDEKRSEAIISAVLATLSPSERVGTIGWCFGGGWSHRATLLAKQRAAACVIYYGMPETETKALTASPAPVLFMLANKDAWITPKIVRDFESTMNRLGKKITVMSFDADHAFANPSNAHHDTTATTTAWNASVAFFHENLK